MISKEVIAAHKLSPVVETIFHWQADDPSHCLLRIYSDDQTQKAYVVASELYSNNEMGKHVSRHFEELALAVANQYPELLDPTKITDVTWICHYGMFSVADSFENIGTPDRLTKIYLVWPLSSTFNVWERKEVVLSESEQEELFSRVSFTSVSEILDRLAGGQ
ncbi:hypothetical protein [Acaryochloris marina]|uniref:Uncharacterized protein n=1 Tax=Acaryochloris marina (strain MBIC 11017) TaxID=329726 RepID=A8ZN25_ACAM1|nr:hypothetical protein [Acaryochloris marina]ABW32224.1 hypothetical protein AM1_C0294 [Acaryochloris marina MBIC11017]